jgi:hypothetical protein
MRKATKPPSEWLNLLCREWAVENQVLVETADAKFLDYKPYLKGLVSSQLLCRLSIPTSNGLSSVMKISNNTDDGGSSTTSTSTNTATDFWEILGICDAFDRAYIVAQVSLVFIPDLTSSLCCPSQNFSFRTRRYFFFALD